MKTTFNPFFFKCQGTQQLIYLLILNSYLNVKLGKFLLLVASAKTKDIERNDYLYEELSLKSELQSMYNNHS